MRVGGSPTRHIFDEAYGYRRMWKALTRAGEHAPRCALMASLLDIPEAEWSAERDGLASTRRFAYPHAAGDRQRPVLDLRNRADGRGDPARR